MAENQFCCPNCQSDNVQKFSVIYMGGVTNTTSHSFGVGVLGQSIDLGAAGIKTKSTSTSELAKQVAPPQKKGYLKVVIISFIVAFIAGGFISSIINSISTFLAESFYKLFVIAVPIFMAYRNYKWNKDVYPELYKIWDSQYLCMRCHTAFQL